MAFPFRIIPKILLYAATVMYPVLVFYFMVIQKTPVRLLSLFVMAFALFAFIAGTSKKKAVGGQPPSHGLPSSSSA